MIRRLVPRWLPLLVLSLLAVLPCRSFAAGQWSGTSPQINLRHIFQGEINRQGRPTGFHSRPGGRDGENARLLELVSPANKAGVYSARVAIREGRHASWQEKFSTFFPDAMEQEQVIRAILHAWQHRIAGEDQPWRGPSGHGFDIQGYLSSRGGIQTAFPVYRKDR